MRVGDKVSIKPHASPLFHAIQFLLGNLNSEYLKTLRSYHGLQAYPSRTKDPDGVDFSTGPVGLGAIAPNFAALVDAYIKTIVFRTPVGAGGISALLAMPNWMKGRFGRRLQSRP